MTQTLPAVASSFYTLCKKCEVERYHKVITHPSPTSAKLQCEVCRKSSTYKLPDPNKKAKTASSSAGRTTKASQKLSAAKSQYALDYGHLKNKSDLSKAKPYNMKIVFQEAEIIQHPKFGTGFVKAVFGDKIEVSFEDETRFLIHNRQ